MTFLQALLISSAVILSVQSFPHTTKDYEKESTAAQETEKATNPIPIYTNDPQAMLEIDTNTEGESSIVKFLIKNPKESLSVQKGSTKEKYAITNLHAKNEATKLNKLDSSKDNKMDMFKNDRLYPFNITGILKSRDIFPDSQNKRDQWLYDQREMSSIIRGLPKYFYDVVKPVYPFPEMSGTVKGIEIDSERKNVNYQVPIIEISNKPPKTSGPLLYPQSVFSREIDVPFYF